MPLVIVAVVIAHVAAARIAPRPAAQPAGSEHAGSGAHVATPPLITDAGGLPTQLTHGIDNGR